MFNLKKLEANKNKSQINIQNSSFYQFAYEDLIDRMNPIERDFKEILVISTVDESSINSLLRIKYPDASLTAKKITDKFPDNKFDLIVLPMCIHWIKDIQNFLQAMYKLLQTNGLLICNFPGGGSLRKLRIKLMEAESVAAMPHTPHISPFIQFDQVTNLLQQAGFRENIIDMEKLELEHDSALDLMQSLKNIGDSNVLEGNSYYSITKRMHQELAQKNNEPFNDQINLITFLSSQAKNTIKLKSEYYSQKSSI